MKNGRTIEVSEAEVVACCDELCREHGGDADKVPASVVLQRVGGGNKRVSNIVKQWRASKIAAAQAPQPVSEDTEALPANIAKALQDMYVGLDALGRCVRHAIAAVLHDERRRASEAAHAAELAANVLLAQEQTRTATAQADAESFSSQLDEALARAEEARAEAERLRAELTTAQEAVRAMTADRDRLAADGEGLRVELERLEGARAREAQRRDQAERRRDELQQEIIAVGRGQEERTHQEQERHRKELAAERARLERLEAKFEAKLEAQTKKVEELLDERQQLSDKVRQLEAELARMAQKPVAPATAMS